ncbi:MAG TPA: phosphotransferase [Mycobacteriales bacterium]
MRISHEESTRTTPFPLRPLAGNWGCTDRVERGAPIVVSAIDMPALADWCRVHLGAAPARVLFETGHLSRVVGLTLTDGRDVVVKARPPAERIRACFEVHRHLWSAGFACPQPLAGPVPLGTLTATAEAYVPGGALPSPRTAQPYADALAALVSLAPPVDALSTLEPPPAWTWWDHDQPGIWPLPDDRDGDLNANAGPDWLDEVGTGVRDRLRRFGQAPVVGHVDWEAQNLCFTDGWRLHAVHDWDSIAARPEATLAGLAAAVYTATGAPATEATIDQTEEFLTAYAHARGRHWTRDELHACWAAGLWVRAFNAKKESMNDPAAPILDRLRTEAPERLRRAGM